MMLGVPPLAVAVAAVAVVTMVAVAAAVAVAVAAGVLSRQRSSLRPALPWAAGKEPLI